MLNFADNAVADVAALAPLTSLLTLTADRNAIEDVAPLNWAGLARLETLSLSGNRLKALPEEVRGAGAEVGLGGGGGGRREGLRGGT